MRQYAGFGTAAESNRRYRYLLEQGVTGLSVAFDLPTQMGYDSDHPLAAGEVGRVGVAIDSIEDMADAVRRHPARPGVDVDDHQRHRHHPAGALRRGRAPAGVAPARLSRHDAERHPEGVRRARHLHLPAARLAPDRHRHLRLLRARSCRTGTRSRSAAITSARRARRRCRRWRSRSRNAIAYVQAARRRRARRRRASASGCRSSSTRTTIFSRRSRSSAPRGGCGRASCATGSARPTRARSSSASTRRPPAAR